MNENNSVEEANEIFPLSFEMVVRANFISLKKGTSAATDRKSYDLHGDDLYNRHRRKNHRIADVRSICGSHTRRIDEDCGISSGARCDANQVVIRDFQNVMADNQYNRYRGEQNQRADQ